MLKLRLTKIDLKYLTQVELKYLKQICFNHLKSQLEQPHAPNSKSSRKQSFGGANCITHQVTLTTIPKDESLKLTKTKNIAIRSKSVDFKFFDDLKETYFSKKVDNAHQVFGQTLYKCILNDIKRQTKSNSTQNTGTITKRWRSNYNAENDNNVMIASKFDLNVLNTGHGTVGHVSKLDAVNKRNSVLFEALDLKNFQKGQRQPVEASVLNGGGGHKPRLSSSRNRLVPLSGVSSPTTVISERKAEGLSEALNQNLSIRSEGLVPNIVKSCCRHISENGLDLVGIFRIDSSKKRIKEVYFKNFVHFFCILYVLILNNYL